MAEIHITEQEEPTTPQGGKTKIYVDEADSHLKTKDDTGFVIDITDTTTPTDNCRIGWFSYTDLATTSTPIVHIGGTETVLTNDGLGTQTLKTFAPNGVTDVWNASNSKFDWTDLKVGDMVDIRVDITVSTSTTNQEVNLVLELGQGGFDYRVPFDQAFYKATGTHPVDRYNGIYIGDANTLDNPAQFIFSSTDNATVVVNGWYVKILIRG